jgi:hypothetical protein
MSGVYLVQHKNGKTKVFVVDGLRAYLCRDGHLVHTEQLPKTGFARSWAQYTRLPENSEVAIKARQCILNSRSKKELVQERSRQIVKAMQEQKARRSISRDSRTRQSSEAIGRKYKRRLSNLIPESRISGKIKHTSSRHVTAKATL